MRLDLVILTLLAGCASSQTGARVILLQSQSYRCGAAPDLGCGLAVAPVLQRIDALEGVAESRVSWDGRYFRIELRSNADGDRVATAVSAVLGEGAARLASAASKTESKRERWLNWKETVDLSRYEAGVIAADFTRDIVEGVQLEAATAERLERTLREELTLAFERAHAAGGTVARLWEQFPEARVRFEARIAEFLTAEQRAQLSTILDQAMEE